MPSRSPVVLSDRAAEVFIAPRVVDESAFSDFAGELRAVVTEAKTAASDALAAAEVAGQAPALAAKISRDLEAASRLLAAAEQQTEQSRLLCEKASAHALDTTRLRTEADRLVEDIRARLDSINHAAAEAAEQRCRVLDVRLQQLIKVRSEQAQTLTADFERALAGAEARVESLQSRVEAIFDSTRDGMASLGERLKESEENARRQIESADEAARAVVRAFIEDAQTQAGRLREDVLARVGPALEVSETLRAACDRGAALIDGSSQAADGDGLTGLVARARQAAESLDQVRRQADEARRALADSLLDSGQTLDSLSDRQRRLDAALREAVSLCDSTERTLGRRAAQAERALERPIAELRAEAETISRDANAAIEQVRAQRQAVDDVAERAESISARLESALSRMEEWRPLLLLRDMIQGAGKASDADRSMP